jgi:frataxin-like iron-binding protein CyaY
MPGTNEKSVQNKLKSLETKPNTAIGNRRSKWKIAWLISVFADGLLHYEINSDTWVKKKKNFNVVRDIKKVVHPSTKHYCSMNGNEIALNYKSELIKKSL